MGCEEEEGMGRRKMWVDEVKGKEGAWEEGRTRGREGRAWGGPGNMCMYSVYF